MNKNKKTSIISVQDISITIASFDIEDYICITDMAKAKSGAARAADIIKNWIRNRSTLEFLGTWEIMYNSSFKVVEFDHFKMQAGLPTFVLSAKQWIEKTNAISDYMFKPVDTVVLMLIKILHLNLVPQLALYSNCILLRNTNVSRI